MAVWNQTLKMRWRVRDVMKTFTKYFTQDSIRTPREQVASAKFKDLDKAQEVIAIHD